MTLGNLNLLAMLGFEDLLLLNFTYLQAAVWRWWSTANSQKDDLNLAELTTGWL